MHISELLRGLADLITSIETDGKKEASVHLEPVTTQEPEDSKETTMVAPLQQEIELMKKTAGVNNVFDQGFDSDEPEDELEIIKKTAGISTEK